MKTAAIFASVFPGIILIFLIYYVSENSQSHFPRNRYELGAPVKEDRVKLNIYVDIGHLSKALDPSCTICDKCVEGKFHVVTTFYPVTHPKWRGSVGAGQSGEVDQQLADRVEELLDVMQRNLNNDLVIAVHVLADHPYSIYLLMNAPLEKKEKLVYHLFNTEISYAMGFKYIQDYLLNKAVIWLNQDIVLGEGVEKINITNIKSQKIAYVLSRRGKTEKLCTMPDPCGPGQPYIGSHDTYIFVVTKQFSADELKELDFKLDAYGAENVFIYFLSNTAKYKVLNPCRVIFTYHVHCRQFHSTERKRINSNGKSGSAPFTDKLE